MRSDDYNRGFVDGFQAAMKIADVKPVDITKPIMSLPNSCLLCGMSFVDSMGRVVTMGYCCPNPKCPSGVHC